MRLRLCQTPLIHSYNTNAKLFTELLWAMTKILQVEAQALKIGTGIGCLSRLKHPL